jgi:hypothetical protein
MGARGSVVGTSRKIAGSNSDGVIGFFNSPNPSAALWAWGRLSL